MRTSASLSRRIERNDGRQTADQLGDQAELHQVVRLDLGQQTVGLLVLPCPLTSAPKPIPCLPVRFWMILLDAVKCTAADKQNIGGIDLDKLLMRMLAAALRRYVGNRALKHFQQCLLYALAR